jgi:hypothetical protein
MEGGGTLSIPTKERKEEHNSTQRQHPVFLQPVSAGKALLGIPVHTLSKNSERKAPITAPHRR